MDCNLPGSSVHRILQARVLVWVAISFSKGSSRPRDRTGSPAFQADALTTEPPGKPLPFFNLVVIILLVFLLFKVFHSNANLRFVGLFAL